MHCASHCAFKQELQTKLQTKLNLVLFQGECCNKNNVCKNWISTCIVVGREKTKNSVCDAFAVGYINSLFGQVDARVHLRNYGTKGKKKIGKKKTF